MSFGIQLLVDAKQVEAAKKSITGLNSLLDDMDKRKDIHMEGALATDAEALRRASNEITKLGSLARIGENKGGLLNIQQWKDVDRITKSIGGYRMSNMDNERLEQLNVFEKFLEKARESGAEYISLQDMPLDIMDLFYTNIKESLALASESLKTLSWMQDTLESDQYPELVQLLDLRGVQERQQNSTVLLLDRIHQHVLELKALL